MAGTRPDTRTAGDVPAEKALLLLACAVSEMLAAERVEPVQAVREEPAGRSENAGRAWRLGGRYWAGPVRGTRRDRVPRWLPSP